MLLREVNYFFEIRLSHSYLKRLPISMRLGYCYVEKRPILVQIGNTIAIKKQPIPVRTEWAVVM